MRNQLPELLFDGRESSCRASRGRKSAAPTGLVRRLKVEPLEERHLLALMATGMVEDVSSDDWITVTLDQDYESMIVVASPAYDQSSAAGVVRIHNVSENSFDMKLDSTIDGASLSNVDVHYLVVEEGVYNVDDHGVKMEAVKYDSARTDYKGSWIGEAQTLSNTYTQPVVFGQVMSYNDSDWSAFWSRSGSSKNDPPGATMKLGKHVGEDTDRVRANETIGYVVIEAGLGVTDGRGFVAGLGSDTVQGMSNAPPYDYAFSGLYSTSTAIVTQAAMDGNDGGWAVLYGSNPLSDTNLKVAIDEDQNDSERSHTTEQVGYLVFEDANAAPVADAGGSYNIKMGDGVYLNGSASFDPDGQPLPLTYRWDLDNDGVFGDATGSIAYATWSQLESFGFTIDSTNTVALQVSDGRATDVAYTDVIVAANVPPTASAGGPYTISMGQTLYLNGSASNDPDGVPSPLTYSWNLDADPALGSDTEFDDATGRYGYANWATLESLGFTMGGTYEIYLQVSDGAAVVTSLPTTVTVRANQSPTASAGGPYTISMGQTLYLNGSASSDPDGLPSPLTYAWDLDDDGEFDDATGAFGFANWATLESLGFTMDVTRDIHVRVSDGASKTRHRRR